MQPVERYVFHLNHQRGEGDDKSNDEYDEYCGAIAGIGLSEILAANPANRGWFCCWT